MIQDVISQFIKFQQQLRILHWGTRSYARHKAFDEIYAELHGVIDKFVEVYQGKYGVIKFPSGVKVDLENAESTDINKLLQEFCKVLIEVVPKEIQEGPTNTDLLNIRDEILGAVNKLKYLLRLK